MMSPKPTVKVLDCTIRDGGFLNAWKFDPGVVREVYRAASKAGVDIVEIGYRGSERHFDRAKYGPWRFSDEGDIRAAVSGIDGARVAVMGDFGAIAADDFPDAAGSPVSLVRVAAHKPELARALQLLQAVKKKGYQVALNAMGAAGYTDAERRGVADLVRDSGLDYVYLADSYGSLFPDQVRGMFEPLLEVPGIQVGFHPHNNLQMAFANTLEAIRCGVHIVDSTMFGMGRGPGNVPTEILLSYLQRFQPDRYNAVPVLNCIDLHFVEYEREHPWGYQLPYMLSGILECHPNYAKNLIDRRRYTMEEIWKVLEVIKRRNTVGYSPALVDEILENASVSAMDAEAVPMVEAGVAPLDQGKSSGAPAYVGRHAGRPFLILGNGPNLEKYQDKIAMVIREHNPIVLGANYLGGLFTPDYHAFTSVKRFKKYCGTVAEGSQLLIGEHIDAATIREYTARSYERIGYRDVLNAPFGIDSEGVLQTNCRTVSVLLLGVAIVMGADLVLAAGLDGYLHADPDNQLLFYDEPDEVRDRELIRETHRWCERHIAGVDAYLRERGRDGVHIITPTSYTRFYKGIDNYLAS